MKKAIIHANIMLMDKVLEDYAIVYDKTILELIPGYEFTHNINTIDANGKYLIPGLIDLHIHGYYGHDSMDADSNGLTVISEKLLQNGVTSFLPTTVTMDQLSVSNALNRIRDAKNKQNSGARILGAHLEGPYLSEEKKGAHESKYLSMPNRGFIEQYLDIIRIITVAPELDPSFIGWAAKKGAIVSLGHSAATFDAAFKAFNDGAKHATHLFNGMSGIHHQDPGVAGAALLHDSVSVELIADTIHVRKELFPLIYKAKGKDKILLITDCMRAGGMPAGKYKLGNLDVYTDGCSARLESGSLAGSILTLNKAVYNFAKYAGIPLYEAVAMASYNSARELKIENECGIIKKGLRADFALADEQMNVCMTVKEGDTVYSLPDIQA